MINLRRIFSQFGRKSYVLANKNEIYELNRRQSKALGRLSRKMNKVTRKIYSAKTADEQARLTMRLETLLEKQNKVLNAENIRKIKLPRQR